MQFEKTDFPGLYVATLKTHADERGFFVETFHKDKFREAGIDAEFLQDNQSVSKKNVIRGLHLQWEKPLGKLIRVSKGRAYVAAVDIRKDSPKFGMWFGVEFDEREPKAIYASPGFATGFAALEEETHVQYKYTALYNSQAEASILLNDPEIGIKWPVVEPIISARDMGALTFKEWLSRPESDLFKL
jgi:dTDP-4-dehydrorhamnose 3,5-epimerase